MRHNRLAAVWSSTTDEGPYNGLLERTAQPSEEALRRFPDELAGVIGIPWFIAYRLWLRQSRVLPITLPLKESADRTSSA